VSRSIPGSSTVLPASIFHSADACLGVPARACQPGRGRVNELTLGNRFGVPMVILHSLLSLLSTILYLYFWVIIASAILSWLIAFNVVNRYNDIVRSIWNLVTALTEPLLRPIRGIIPNLGGIDISPVILLLFIGFIKSLIDGYNDSIGF
jgi:YggT family protein